MITSIQVDKKLWYEFKIMCIRNKVTMAEMIKDLIKYAIEEDDKNHT